MENDWRQRFRSEIIFSHGSSKSKGVAILIGSKLECSIIDQLVDVEGRLIILKCIIQGSEFLLINSYFPNTEKEQIAFLKSFYEKFQSIEKSTDTSIIWGGDFNIATNIDLETKAQLIRDNHNIEGFNLDESSENEVKLVLFADDTTFTLKNLKSLMECLKVLNNFKKYSSLELNLNKSEVGWVGPKMDASLLPEIVKKKIDFHQQGIRILGIYFSHNRDFVRKFNYERVFEKFKSVLHVWKMRQLTIFGKAIVVKSLAISQLLYVFGNLPCPLRYIEKVKDEIANFIWNGRKPKIKYDTLISNLQHGGIKLPDFESMIQANRVRWAVKMMYSDNDVFWRAISNFYFKPFYCNILLGENFDNAQWNRTKITSQFYEEVLNAWSSLSKTTVIKREDILKQHIWFNWHIVLNMDSKRIIKFVNKGILMLKHVWVGTEPNWNKAKNIGWSNEEYLVWRGILNAIPKEWKEILRQPAEGEKHIDEKEKNIEISGRLLPAYKVNTNMIYWELISKKAKQPTSHKNLANKLGLGDIEWASFYLKIYESTIDVKLRVFQYKILNNILYLNEKLFLFKVVESDKCSFCKEQNESFSHFFIECRFTQQFYFDTQKWLSNVSIGFPLLNLRNVTLGPEENIVEYFLLLLWKYTLYSCRSKCKIPTLQDFKSTVKLYEKMEYIVAKKKSRLTSHLRKYENIMQII